MTKYVVEVANCVELKKKNYDAFAVCASARALEGEDECWQPVAQVATLQEKTALNMKCTSIVVRSIGK